MHQNFSDSSPLGDERMSPLGSTRSEHKDNNLKSNLRKLQMHHNKRIVIPSEVKPPCFSQTAHGTGSPQSQYVSTSESEISSEEKWNTYEKKNPEIK